MKLRFLLLLCALCLSLQVSAMDKWAIVIGVSSYPRLQGKFPQLPHASRDARYIADILGSEHCRFEPSKTLLLLDENATSTNVRRVFRRYLSQTKPQDAVFVFFFGHGMVASNSSFYWLLADSNPGELAQSSLSFDELGFLLWNYVAADNIFVCSDARHSPHALGEVSLGLREALSSKNVCLMESSDYDQQANVRGGRGLFSHFLLSALRGIPYLERTADSNGDGYITISEVAHFVPWAMGFSGLGQNPISEGSLSITFADLHPHSTFLHVVEPRMLTGEAQQVKVRGFVRDDNGVGIVTIADKSAKIAPITPDKAKELRLASSGNTYWFETQIDVSNHRQLDIEVTDYRGNQKHFDHPLVRLERGWHGEWMPPGMKKADREGIYMWQRDQTPMVYIPPGEFFIGRPHQQIREMHHTIDELLHYFRQYLGLFTENGKLKKLLVKGLEQSNEALLRIGNKLLFVDNKVRLLDKVNRKTSRTKEKEEQFPEEIPEDLLKSQSQLTREQTLQFFVKARSVLSRCYQDLFVLTVKQNEIEQSIRYLQLLQQLDDDLELLWSPKKVQNQGFYIDAYEVDNGRYLDFCRAASRPYPADPWWEPDYLWKLPSYPVVNVSWEDASAYATWAGKQLPTSQQWEIAARGHSGYIYPWGNEPPDRNHVNADVPPSMNNLSFSILPLQPVATTSTNKGASTFGCHHMAGNVWEWCRDAPFYPKELWKPQHQHRISKGGSFASTGFMLSTWFEHPFPAKMRRSDLGFRCVVKSPMTNEVR